MNHKTISFNEYFSQFTLDNLINRKHNSTPKEWKAWVESLHEYEVNCIAHTLYMDPIVRTKYDSIRLSKIMNKSL